jgi:hypothetical protein
MPFIVQCPHDDCRRFMLLEDHVRGRTVHCVICERQIVLDPSGSDDRPKPPPLVKPSASVLPRAERQRILRCPRCEAPLRLPPSHEGKAIRCPACKHVFKP